MISERSETDLWSTRAAAHALLTTLGKVFPSRQGRRELAPGKRSAARGRDANRNLRPGRGAA